MKSNHPQTNPNSIISSFIWETWGLAKGLRHVLGDWLVIFFHLFALLPPSLLFLEPNMESLRFIIQGLYFWLKVASQ